MNPHNLRGKGIWIWKAHQCENGNLDAIVSRAQDAGFTHVIVKIADGDDPYNIWDRRDYAAELIPKLRNAGITVWGWNYIYGDPPARDQGKPKYWELEAQGNVRRIKQLIPMGLQGFVIDAEKEYETIFDRHNKAAAYMRIMRDNLPDFPLALASWKYPASHGGFTWSQFRSKIDLDMPQVYWIKARDPVAQLDKCFPQFQALQPQLPFVPVGPSFFEHDWRPTAQEITDFFARSLALGFPAASLWAWDHLGLRGNEPHNPRHWNFTAEWDAAARFQWPGVTPAAAPTVAAPVTTPTPVVAPAAAEDILAQYFSGLNARDLNKVIALYAPNAGHVSAEGSVIGAQAIRTFYAGLFAKLPDAKFTLTGSNSLGTIRTFNWIAAGTKNFITDGSDSIGLVNGRVQYHHTVFTFKAAQ
jgi:hypothetical protein